MKLLITFWCCSIILLKSFFLLLDNLLLWSQLKVSHPEEIVTLIYNWLCSCIALFSWNLDYFIKNKYKVAGRLFRAMKLIYSYLNGTFFLFFKFWQIKSFRSLKHFSSLLLQRSYIWYKWLLVAGINALLIQWIVLFNVNYPWHGFSDPVSLITGPGPVC